MTVLPAPRLYEQAVRRGEMTKITHTTRLGNAGDIIDTPWKGVRVRLLRVSLYRLDAAAIFYAEQGEESRADFMEAWASRHPGSGFKPDQRVFLHTFEVVRRARSPFEPAPQDQMKLM